jgi:catalase
MPQQEKDNLCANLAGPLSVVPQEILNRQLALFDKADPAYGAGVRAALKQRGANVD